MGRSLTFTPVRVDSSFRGTSTIGRLVGLTDSSLRTRFSISATPEQYLAEAEAALSRAIPSDLEGAEKAVEIGKVYKVYEELLQENNSVDSGDLVMLAAKLLQEHEDSEDAMDSALVELRGTPSI